MKRSVLALLLAALTLLTLTTAAFADNAANGVYSVQSKNGYTFSVDGATSDGGFYAGADTFTLKCSSASGETLVYLLKGTEETVPTADNLWYIDQQTASGTETTFTLKPKALEAGQTYRVYVSTTNTAPKEAGSFSYGIKPEFTLGDVDNDGKVTAFDALMALKASAEVITLNATEQLAADVDKSGAVNAFDALMILKYSAEVITSFD